MVPLPGGQQHTATLLTCFQPTIARLFAHRTDTMELELTHNLKLINYIINQTLRYIKYANTRPLPFPPNKLGPSKCICSVCKTIFLNMRCVWYFALLTILIDLLDDLIQLLSCWILAQHPHHGTQLLGADITATISVEQVKGGFELWGEQEIKTCLSVWNWPNLSGIFSQLLLIDVPVLTSQHFLAQIGAGLLLCVSLKNKQVSLHKILISGFCDYNISTYIQINAFYRMGCHCWSVENVFFFNWRLLQIIY